MQPSYQLVPVPLPTVAFSPNGRAQVLTDAIPADIDGRPAHLARIDFELVGTPTLSSGTLTAAEISRIISKVTIKDGVRTLFDESLETLRIFNALESGSLLYPENDDIVTATEFAVRHSWSPGPKGFVGGIVDFVCVPGALDGNPIELQFPALTAIDANLTALSCTIQPVAWMAVLDDVRISPKFERRTQSLRSDDTITGEEDLYAFVGLARPLFAAMATGDIGNIQILNSKAETQSVNISLLEKAYHEDMKATGLSLVHGEQRNAQDDNPKVVNGAGTGLAAAAAVVSPVIWSPLGQRISKLVHEAKGKGLRLKWTGSLAPALALISRFDARTRDEAGKYLEIAAKALKVPVSRIGAGGGDVATLSKRPYAGPRSDFMPLRLKVG
jgi:hypothetical protein